MIFYLHKKPTSKGHPILYPLEKNNICDYNLRCLLSSRLMFDEIIMDIIRNKVLEFHVEGVDSYFIYTEKNKIHMNRGSLQ